MAVARRDVTGGGAGSGEQGITARAAEDDAVATPLISDRLVISDGSKQCTANLYLGLDKYTEVNSPVQENRDMGQIS